jgi:hypothetical protein
VPFAGPERLLGWLPADRLAAPVLDLLPLSRSSGAGFVAFAVDRPGFPLGDGVYKLRRESKSIFARLSREQYWENIAEVNRDIQFFEIPVRVKRFTKGRAPHLNERAVDQVMKDLADLLKGRIG